MLGAFEPAQEKIARRTETPFTENNGGKALIARKSEINQHFVFVYSSERHSSRCPLDTRLIHPPGCRTIALVPVGWLLQARCVEMDSAHDVVRTLDHATLIKVTE